MIHLRHSTYWEIESYPNSSEKTCSYFGKYIETGISNFRRQLMHDNGRTRQCTETRYVLKFSSMWTVSQATQQCHCHTPFPSYFWKMKMTDAKRKLDLRQTRVNRSCMRRWVGGSECRTGCLRKSPHSLLTLDLWFSKFYTGITSITFWAWKTGRVFYSFWYEFEVARLSNGNFASRVWKWRKWQYRLMCSLFRTKRTLLVAMRLELANNGKRTSALVSELLQSELSKCAEQIANVNHEVVMHNSNSIPKLSWHAKMKASPYLLHIR